MSTAAHRFRASASRRVFHFGDGSTAVRRESSSLKNPNTGAVVSTLAVNGLTALGATSIDLDAAAVTGKLPAGSTLTIFGDATTYTTTGDVTAASNALASVGINALAAEAADDAVVTITQPYGEKTYHCKRSSFETDEVDGERITLKDYKLEIATADEMSAEDATWLHDGQRVKVVGILPFSPGTEQASVILHCRG